MLFFTLIYLMDAKFGYLHLINILQKRCLRIMNFSTNRDHINPLFLNNNIIKFCDMIKLYHLMFVKEFINQILPHDFKDFIIFNKDFHTYDTRSSSSSGLHMCLISTTTFGLNSLKYT